MSTQKRIDTVVALQLQELLQNGKPKSYAMLAEALDLTKVAVARWAKTLRTDEMWRIYVADWGDDARGRKFVPLFAWDATGEKEDVPRAGARNTSKQRMARMRLRKKGVPNADLMV